jgi:hypothetical protein
MSAAVLARLSPRDTRFSEQTRALASNQTQAGDELPRLETQSGLAQASLVIGPLGRLPFRLRGAPLVTKPHSHLDGPTMEEHGATQDHHGTPAQNTLAVVRTVSLCYPARLPRSGCHLRICPGAVDRMQRELDHEVALERSDHVLSQSLGRTAAAHPPFVMAP